ncbi:sarcosine oxidase [Litoreibacter ponti]|uniref:Sarcosine oxidase n=1 Tax=Litoreibacter ponti TaxID=1510457 RepID=A0A2T6BDR3_9RHOB|nr:FAD-binding oxidoreductase [Litoreibacter ponti]PTX54218.1 sarcosine oxidase [Litoreibacter ponti]
MSVAVIGRGLWGSAAARHLAKAGVDVTLIGPGEPAAKRSHTGVFASHWDEGRITRKNALDPYWVGVSTAAIDRYAEIEAESGIAFYTETGAMMAGGAAFMARMEQGRAEYDVPCEQLGPEALAQRFPYFSLGDFTGYYEPTRAGHISPRRLVAAQTKAATRHGAKLLERQVTGLEPRGAMVEVATTDGTHRFDQVLIACGYNSDNVLGRAPQMDVYARTVALFEVSEQEAARLATMPTLVYDTPEDPYLLPPIRYPDGKIYLKLGGDPEDAPLVGGDAIRDWFQGGGNAEVRGHLHKMVLEVMPDLDIRGVTMDACVTTWTKDRLPEIGWVADRIAICAGGNGAGAKCSDEIGRLGAALVKTRLGVSA